VEYSNLSPGKYVFHIKALAKNVWGSETQLVIVINQPWYNTWLAWIIYLSIIFIAGYAFYRNAKERLKLSQQMRVEKELADFRINFFTHITHEFRTPLAIIQNAIDKLAQPGVPTRSNIQTAKRGTHRLLRLVNQFMEFRKIDTGNVKLNVEKD
jgi:signal transduction histidine kinase